MLVAVPIIIIRNEYVKVSKIAIFSPKTQKMPYFTHSYLLIELSNSAISKSYLIEKNFLFQPMWQKFPEKQFRRNCIFAIFTLYQVSPPSTTNHTRCWVSKNKEKYLDCVSILFEVDICGSSYVVVQKPHSGDFWHVRVYCESFLSWNS